MNFINGLNVEPVENRWLAHVNPWTGETDSELALSGIIDVVRSIQAAHKAQNDWTQLDTSVRAAYLQKIADLIDAKSDALAETQSRDQGSVASSAREYSIPAAAYFFRSSAELILAPRDLETELPANHHQAFGLVCIITPWTDPLVEIAKQVAPALAAGNTVLLKPSEFAPGSAAALAEIIAEAGLPAGVFNMVQGRGSEVGSVCVNHPGLKVLSFTGSTETSLAVARDAAEMGKRVHFARGAQNPCLIFNGVDIEKTAKQVARLTSTYFPAIHRRAQRIFIQEAIYKSFMEQLISEVKKLDLGPLAHSKLKEDFFSASQLAEKESGKALFATGQNKMLGNGFQIAPYYSYDLTHCSTLQQTEVIGPFATLSSFKYQHDALKHANVGEQARVAYIFEPDHEKAFRVAKKLIADEILINSFIAASDLASVKIPTLDPIRKLMSFFSRKSTIY